VICTLLFSAVRGHRARLMRRPLVRTLQQTGMDIILRAATTDDTDFLYRLHRAAMQEYVVQTWGQWDEAWQSHYFQQHFDPAACQIIVLHGQDIGVISVVRQVTDIFLSNIELLPAYQGLGIGTQLIKALVDEAHRKRVPITLQVLKVNPARRLYERLGFSISGETTTHYQMSATLSVTT
jgi:ribosomal protein S18 acetylase RimI-like enzyme